jgi:predicted ATP-grasp superfamily ATP-dependent carboligase
VSAYRDIAARYGPDHSGLPFIQEHVPGTDYVAAGLFHHGEPRAGIVARSIRNLPPAGGLMVVRVSVVQREMAGYLEALAAEMKWHGVIMADFRLDERDNTPRLLDVNPRLWGSLYQAVASGVEFPCLLYRMALDGDVSPAPAGEAGVRTRCLWNDTRALPAYLRRPGSRLRTIREFLDFRATKYDDMSLRDPLPVLAMALNIPIRLVVRRPDGRAPQLVEGAGR